MSSPNPPIAILGAGPAGLTLARLLTLSQIPYIVYERDASAALASHRGASGTLDLHAHTAQRALKEAGLYEEFKKRARFDVPTVLADKQGRVHARLQGEGDTDRPEIDRTHLREMLLESVPGEKVVWGAKVENVEREDDGSMGIRFADGKSVSGFRLVVGADGAWSKARALCNPAKPQYSGFQYLTTEIKPSNPFHATAASLAGRGNYMAFGDGKFVLDMLLGDGTYFTGAALRLPEGFAQENNELMAKDPVAYRDLLVDEHFAEWPKELKGLLAHGQEVRPWPLYFIPPESLAWETVPGIALIGDAAHLTTPFVGEGVNCAMYDSYVLAQQIVKHGLDDLTAAVAEYEKDMLPRGIDLIERSEESGKLLFGANTPQSWLAAHGVPSLLE